MTLDDGTIFADSAPRGPRARILIILPKYRRNGLDHVVYFERAGSHPADVFAYGREAIHCFMDKRYLATITMAYAMVELILNKDSRMPAAKWRTLNMKLVRTAKSCGLPVDRLLDRGESLTSQSINFIDLRNKIAHGNLTDLIGLEHCATTDYSAQAREIALRQLRES